MRFGSFHPAGSLVVFCYLLFCLQVGCYGQGSVELKYKLLPGKAFLFLTNGFSCTESKFSPGFLPPSHFEIIVKKKMPGDHFLVSFRLVQSPGEERERSSPYGASDLIMDSYGFIASPASPACLLPDPSGKTLENQLESVFTRFGYPIWFPLPKTPKRVGDSWIIRTRLGERSEPLNQVFTLDALEEAGRDLLRLSSRVLVGKDKSGREKISETGSENTITIFSRKLGMPIIFISCTKLDNPNPFSKMDQERSWAIFWTTLERVRDERNSHEKPVGAN